MMFRIVSAICISTLLYACTANAPQEPQFSDDQVILGTLHRVENARVGVAYLDPNADFGVFNRVMLDPLDLSKVNIVQPTAAGSATNRRAWELNDTDIERLQIAFREVFERELAETGDYGIAKEAGPDVLRISASVTQIAPSAARDDNRSRPTGRTRVYSEGAGSMSIAFGFSDSESGEVIAVVKDSRRGTPTWGVNNSVSNMSDVRFMFGRWARMIRARLDIAHGY